MLHSPGVRLASCIGLCVSSYRWRLGVVMQLLELAYPDKSHAVPKMDARSRLAKEQTLAHNLYYNRYTVPLNSLF